MCGIFGLFGLLRSLGFVKETKETKEIKDLVETLTARGPEHTAILDLSGATLGFTRLAINGLTPAGNQPMNSPSGEWVVVCNGEIYNYKELATRFSIPSTYLGSDCFVIPWLLEKYSVKQVCRLLDGVFAFIGYNTKTGEMVIGRDTFGVRPLFYVQISQHEYAFASEIKALCPLNKEVCVFPPSSLGSLKKEQGLIIEPWTALTWHKRQTFGEQNDVFAELRNHVLEAVKKRLLSERPVGALLSGGLDSSLIASIAAREMAKEGKRIHTFSIGLSQESPDIKAARLVAAHINSIHHELVFSKEEFLDAVEPVIKAVETYDITSVRASVGNWLLGKWIKANTDIKVIFNGDGSDELFGGYLYFYRAPDELAFDQEIERLLSEIHCYDVLRSERSMASHGLESRTPFLDRQLVDFVRRLPTDLCMPSDKRPEKWLLRTSFANEGLLPPEILWRRKEAFSDGVSSAESSWFEVLKHTASQRLQSSLGSILQKHNPPLTAEAHWYRSIFEEAYGAHSVKTIPHMWMPQWSPDTTDPSARTLGLYAEQKVSE